MAINPSDIKLLESERMTDYEDGGGRRTSRVIPDGVAGNIFPKVSRLDSVYGRVNIRKVYGAVQTANLDTYAGAHAVITDPPNNNRIHCLLFSTGSEYDTRTQARDRIESYVITGPESRMVLYGRQLEGQMAILAYQRVEAPLPEVGEVYALSAETGGVVTNQQYVRIQDVEHEVRTFTDTTGDFTRRVLSLKISAALRYDFTGPEVPSRFSNVTRPTLIRSTTVADAARYYGIVPLVEDAQANDLTVKVSSVYAPIVPTTQRETAVSLAQINGASAFTAIGAQITESTTIWNTGTDTDKTYYLRRAALPGSVTINPVGANWAVEDDGVGNIVVTSDPDSAFGANSVNLVVGLIDYDTAFIRPNRSWTGTSHTVRWTPAAETSQPAHSKQIKMTLANRGAVFAVTLNPLPAPGTTIVDYRALGKWYRLRDDGAGKLSGDDAAYGVGSIDYVTGALIVTLGALPDVDSSVLFSWGTPAHYKIRAGATSDSGTKAVQRFFLTDLPVSPDSLSLAVQVGAGTVTVTDDANGNLTGTNITGKVVYSTGEVTLEYASALPNAGSSIEVSYNQLVASNGTDIIMKSELATFAAAMSLGEALSPNSLSMSVPVFYDYKVVDNHREYGQITVRDNGAGALHTVSGKLITESGIQIIIPGGVPIGAVNYATGAINFTNDIDSETKVWASNTGLWEPRAVTIKLRTGEDGSIGWKTTAATDASAKTFTLDMTSAPESTRPRVQIAKTTAEPLVAGSILFTLAGKSYFDRNGVIYTDMNSTTGSATAAGTVNYDTGDVSLTYWADNTAISLSVIGGLSKYGNWDMYEAFFRTSGSPIRVTSFYIQVTALDGELLTGTADANGVITGAKMFGSFQYDMGVAEVSFGEAVVAAGNETEWWYDPANVSGGMIWKPREVIPETLRYSCVVLSNLPLSADILGLDPVRLPSDGRVPIFRSADVAVVQAVGFTNLPATVTPGATYDLSDTNLAEVWVVDDDGEDVPIQYYGYNPTTGKITIAADFNATAAGIVEPMKVIHRIEDLVLLSDVQLNGELSLTAPLSRDYPAGSSYVASALLFGDMNARVTNVFDQATWTNVWQNSLIGSQATSEYNLIDYPFEVLNDGAVTERWRLNFTTTTAFQIIGESLGVIGTGTTAADVSVVNALTGKPYFTIRAAGFGSGWSAGNQIRFNTYSAGAPIWITRTILPGATLDGDSFTMQMRGDVDI